MEREFIHKIFSTTTVNFEQVALDIFRFQCENNPIYGQFVHALHVQPKEVNAIHQIPFLPVEFFRSHDVKTTVFSPEIVFESSGTTGSINSQHLVREIAIYQRSFISGFQGVYGNPEEWCIIGLLPSYLERKNSSLIMMVDQLIKMSHHSNSGFYLDEHERLHQILQVLEKEGQKTMLIGVTFALLDFAEKYPMKLQHTTILETGGMKGRRKEITREEVHQLLKDKMGVLNIHSEYGMTELLSQAWSKGKGIFRCPPWMRAMARDEDDPLLVSRHEDLVQKSDLSGILNIIDLANIYSCAFIATDDVGKIYPDGSFEVMGRMDNADLRGCSLMVA